MGWNPSEFPPLPNGDVLEQHAGKLRTKAEGIQSAAEESHTLWAGMSTAYKGPGDWQVHIAFNKVASEAEVVLEDANTVADAIDTFAEWAREAKRRYNALYADWLAVQSRIDDGGDDWREDQDLVNDDNNILKSADALLAEHMEAERTCATAISGLFDGPSYVVTTQDGPGANQVAYGYTADQLDAAAAEGNIPWGEPTEWDKPWYRDALDGVVSFGKGVWSGITGTVTGLWNMVNFTDMETFSATWKGIGTLALDVAIVATPVAQVALRATGNTHIVDQSAERLVAVGKAAVHWDDWKRDPAYAAGASAFDLASILLTAGGGAVAKTGSVASAVTRVGSTGSRVASVVNATGLTKVAGYTGRVIDLGSALKINTVNFATDTARVTLGRVAPAAVRVDNLINDVGTSLSGPRAAYAGVSTGNGPGPVSTRLDNLINRFDAEGPAQPNRGTAPDAMRSPGSAAPDGTRAGSGSGPSPERSPGAIAGDGAGSEPRHGHPQAGAGTESPERTPGATAEVQVPEPEAAAIGMVEDVPADPPGAQPGSVSGPDTAGAGLTGPSAEAPRAVVHTDATGRPVSVEVDGKVHTVATRSDQIAQLPRSTGSAALDSWDNPEALLQTRLPADELAELDGFRRPDGSLPNEVLDQRIAGLIEREFGTADGGGPQLPRDASNIERALAPFTNRYYYDLTDAQSELLYDLRHAMGTGDETTLYQKVMPAGNAEQMLAGTTRYFDSVGGFVSKAADTESLRSVDDIINGLRLDYWNSQKLTLDGSDNPLLVRYNQSPQFLGTEVDVPTEVAFMPGQVDDVVAIRFRTPNADEIAIPDGSNHNRVDEIRRNRSAETAAGTPVRPEDVIRSKREADNAHGNPIANDPAMWPNTGHGFTSSRVDGTPIVPELQVQGGVPLAKGAEMWRINKAGEEVLIGIFDQKWIRV